MLLARRAQLSLLRANTRAHSIRCRRLAPAAARCSTYVGSTPAAAQPHHRFTSVCAGPRPERIRKSPSGREDQEKGREPDSEKLQQLFREHGVAFGALYVGANVGGSYPSSVL